jgi:uncharacterized circularly permuted ATP-grasp superfamily protein
MPTAQQKLNETFMEKLDKMGEQLAQALIKLESLPSNLTLELDKRYADKRTEKNVDRLSWLVISAIVVAGLALIIK